LLIAFEGERFNGSHEKRAYRGFAHANTNDERQNRPLRWKG
jgi:hypothetical protein